MKKMILFLLPLSLCVMAYSQLPVAKRIDSIVNSINAKKTLAIKSLSDTFPTVNPDVVTIESVKFYSSQNKLAKVIFSAYYHSKDTTKNDIHTDLDVFYFNNDVLIKVSSKDFDQSPPKDLQLYFNEQHLKKFLAKQTQHFTKFDGTNYFIELGYNLREEFKFLTKK